MVLALSAMALPDAGSTGSTLSTGMAYALQEGDTATRTTTAMAAVGDLDTAALHENSEKVALAAYDLGDPETDIDVGIKRDRDVARRHGGKSVLGVLYKDINKGRKRQRKGNNVR
jgi:hypothetical protein